MRMFRGAVLAPIMVGLVITAAGCGTTAAVAQGRPSTYTAPPASSTPASQGNTNPTSSAVSPSSTAGSTSKSPSSPPPVSPSSVSPSSAFPGIWDITSWEQYRATQASVEQGHQPWLLDPASVVQAWAHRWNPVPPVRQIKTDTFQVTEPGTNVVYTIRGTRPDPTGSAPIWVITQITHS